MTKGGEVWQVRFVDSETREELDPESLVSKKLDILRCVLVVDNIFIEPRWKKVQVFVKEAIVKTRTEVRFLDLNAPSAAASDRRSTIEPSARGR